MASTLFPVTNKYFQVDTTSSLNTSLISYWKMEGNSHDFFSSNNGTDTSVTYSTGNGKYLQGAGFDGSSSYISLGTPSNLRISPSVSISAWIKTSSGSTEVIEQLSTPSLGGHIAYGISVNSSGQIAMRVEYASSLFSNLNTTTTVTDGNWHHIVCIYNAGTQTIYIDNVSRASGGTGSSIYYETTSGGAYMGVDFSGGSDSSYFNGDLDEVGIWAKALSTTEIANLYNSGNAQTMVGNVSDSETEVDTVTHIYNAGIHLLVNPTPETETEGELVTMLRGSQPLITFRSATYPYSTLSSPFIFSEMVANQSGLPVLAGDNSDSTTFRVYNNFGLSPNIGKAYNVTLTTYDNSAHSTAAIQSLVVQQWVSLQENGFGVNSNTTNAVTFYQDNPTFVGGSSNVKTFEYGSDGSVGSTIAAGTNGNGCGFIEVNTFCSVPLGQVTGIYSAVLTAEFDWIP